VFKNSPTASPLFEGRQQVYMTLEKK